MRVRDLSIEGPLVLEPAVHGDERGFFVETYRRETLAEAGIDVDFVQDNHSRSGRGVLRGIHFQVGEGQAKLVRCARGSVFDAVVDLRVDSPTFGRWDAAELDDESMRMMWVPVGFGHAFCVTSEVADVVYKCSSYYDAGLERGIRYDDPAIGVEWPAVEPVVSDRDARAPLLSQLVPELPFRTGAGSVA
jgi:dTDP-4-dehydrorhamnose 3,5-epimerase